MDWASVARRQRRCRARRKLGDSAVQSATNPEREIDFIEKTRFLGGRITMNIVRVIPLAWRGRAGLVTLYRPFGQSISGPILLLERSCVQQNEVRVPQCRSAQRPRDASSA